MSKAPSWGRLDNEDRTNRPFRPARSGAAKASLLAYGNGRSYGDSCHNDDGCLLTTQHNNAIVSFDRDSGLLVAEAGMLLSDILNFLADTGWFLPVVPGTKFVTLGGAIANDIHGKNHHKRGTFGAHVGSFDVWRSDGSLTRCSATNNAELFAATIGGLGLTGVITRAEIRLMKVGSHFVRERKRPFRSLDEFFDLETACSDSSEYSVAWVDSLATGSSLGRGILINGDHVDSNCRPQYGLPRWKVPVTPPVPLVAGLPLRLFNLAYFHGNKRQSASRVVEPDSFFFPLDAIAGWNRLYGPRGLYQHQSVIPPENAQKTISALLQTSQDFGQGSFLTVLKRFGTQRSPGFMSFPKPGFTLTLDFANKGANTLALLDRLDTITLEAGGRLNPYKDARMSASTFQHGYPLWQNLETMRDPAFISDFWKRTASRIATSAPALDGPGFQTAVNHTAKRDVHSQPLEKTSDDVAAWATGLGPK
jgi:FAD/FMN-containing dehydrogenase